MKRALSVTLLAAASSACLAQTATQDGVVVYGIIDVGVQNVSGYAAGTDNAVVSGIMDGSRIGIRGSEDLGGGYRSLFTMENRTEANNGATGSRPVSGTQVPDRLIDARYLVPALCPANTPSGPSGLPVCPVQGYTSGVAAQIGSTIGVNLNNAFWDRQIYVGLVTPYGAVLAGRQYTPAYETFATFDVTATQSSLSAGQVAAIPAAIDIRLSNTVQYRIAMGGLTASAMYAFGGVSGNPSAGRFGGVMASYKAGGLAVGAAYQKKNNDVGQASLTSSVLAASYAIGPGTISGMLMMAKDDNPSGVSGIASGLMLTPAPNTPPALVASLIQAGFTEALRQDLQLINIGYRITTGPNTFYVAYTSANDKRPNNADVASYGVLYSYALSKRTDLNTALTHFDNKNLAQAAPGGGGYLGGVTATAGTDSNSIAFGIRHRF
jgi:GBP family porin